MDRIDTLNDSSKKNLAAAGGVLGAILASTCCLGPLLLVTLGVGGAWVGNLSALEPYQPIFISVALIFLGFGFWQVYFKPKKACDEGSYCATPTSDWVVKSALWAGTILVVVALTIDYWAPLFY